MRASLLMVLAATLFAAGDVVAQACIGGPLPRQLAIGARAETTESGKGYGGEFLSTVGAGFTLGAGFSMLKHDDIDNTGTRATALAAFEAPSQALSICPAVGVAYSNARDLVAAVDVAGNPILNAYADLRSLRIPLTLNVGTRIGLSEGAYLVPFAGAGIIHERLRGDGFGFEVNEDSNTFGGNGGVLIGLENLYVRAGVSATQAATDPILSLGVGFIMR